MPKIPSSPFGRTRISTDVGRRPTRAPGQAGMVEEAFARFGTQAADLAGELIKRRQKSERDAYVHSQAADLSIRMNEIQAERKSQFGGNFNNYSTLVEQDFDKEVKRRIKEAPNGEAANAFEVRAAQLKRIIIPRAQAFENVQAAKFNRNLRRQTSDNLGVRYMESPDVNQAQIDLNRHIEDINEGVGVDYTSNEASVLEAEARLKVATGMVEGLSNLGRFQEAISLIQNNFGKAYSDEKTRNKAIDKVASRLRQGFNNNIKQQFEQDRSLPEEFENNEEGIVEELLDRTIQGQPVPAVLLDRVDANQTTVRANNLVVKKSMSPVALRKNDDLRNTFNERLLSNESVSTIRQDLYDAISNGRVSAEDSAALLKQMTVRRKTGQSKFLKRREQAGNKLIIASLPTRNLITRLDDPERLELRLQATFERDILVGRGVDPFLASKAVVKKYKDVFQVPFVHDSIVSTDIQRDKKEFLKQIPQIRMKVLQMFKEGKLKKEETATIKQDLDDRLQAFESEDFKSINELLQELDNARR